MTEDKQQQGSGVRFRPDELARQIEESYRDAMRTAGRPFDVLVGIGSGVERVGDTFRFREACDVLLEAAIAMPDAGPVRVTFNGRRGRPLIVEFEGVGRPTDRLLALVGQISGEVSVVEGVSGDILRLSLAFPEAPAAEPAPVAPAASRPFENLRLLIADDSPTNLRVMEEMLADTGAEVVSVKDGQQALDVWRQQRFDMLLLDIAMPVMDGLTALTRIRGEEDAGGQAHTSAIAVTANAMPQQVAEYILGGFDTHLSKPFRRHELIDTISALRPLA